MKRGCRKAVFIVAYKKENKKIFYLLLKRKLHWTGWEFPKGGIEKNETPVLAVLRELNEETGLSPLLISNHYIHGKYKYDKKTQKDRKYRGQEFSLFSAELKSKKVKTDKKEHSAYKWLSFEEAEKLLKWKNQKECLKIVNKNLE